MAEPQPTGPAEPGSARDGVSPAPFVVGVPRSGTTLLRLMLDAHPRLTIPPETHFLPALIIAWRADRAEGVLLAERRRRAVALVTGHPRWPDLGLDGSALERRVQQCDDLRSIVRGIYALLAETAGKPRWGDKTPAYLTKMPRIQRVLPEASFVHVIRDGRDVALSLGEVSWGTDDVAEVARTWVKRISAARDHSERLAPGTYREVRYEDLVADPETALRPVADALALPWDAAMLAYHEQAADRMPAARDDFVSLRGKTITAAERARQHALVAEPPRADRVGRWREGMSSSDRRSFERVAGDLLEELGYPVAAAS